MRIALVTNKRYPNPRGSSGGLESLREELLMRGHKVFVFASTQKNGGRQEGQIYRFRVTELFGKRLVWNSWQVVQKLSSLEVDMVHTQQYDGLGKVAKDWALREDVPWIQTVSDVISVRKGKSIKEKPSIIITPAKALKRMLEEQSFRGEDIAVIPSGVDPKIFEGADGLSIRRKWDIPSDAKVLLSVSRITQEKNSQFLFQSLLSLIKRREDIYLFCVGGGDLLEFFRTEILARNLQNRIFFTEEVSKYEMKHYYDAGDVFVYVSKEDFRATVVAEAMCAKLPVVAVRSGGSQERVIDGVTGFLTEDFDKKNEFSNKVEYLLENKEIARTFGEAGYSHMIKEYTNALCVDALLSVYEHALNKKKSK
ncbi:MAG: glycosyltransferase family 1 protein [Candidatus Moranbacteria bacterium]|nr:glycosyltransferase family 1 protein [Candidatus Moranbacteria bacterium]